jgi:hypothetical protein
MPNGRRRAPDRDLTRTARTRPFRRAGHHGAGRGGAGGGRRAPLSCGDRSGAVAVGARRRCRPSPGGSRSRTDLCLPAITVMSLRWCHLGVEPANLRSTTAAVGEAPICKPRSRASRGAVRLRRRARARHSGPLCRSQEADTHSGFQNQLSRHVQAVGFQLGKSRSGLKG